MKVQLSIIIVNFNVKYFLEHCLNSVLQAVLKINAEIIVVDNHSTDGSKEYFHNRFETVQFLWNDANVGFAKANNLGIQHASGEYILFLNPDTIIAEDCLEKCLEYIQSKNNRCAAGVKMIDGSGRFLKESKRSFPYPHTSLFKLLGLASIFPRSPLFARYHLGHLDENESHRVDVLAGAFMMLPRDILTATGGFDEDFFMYGEDIDLSYRIQQAGFENYYFANTVIIHFKGESTKKGSLNYVLMFYRAMSIFVKKHYRSGRAGMLNFLIQLAIVLRATLSAGVRFLKWIGLPVIDLMIILLSFYGIKVLWSVYVRQEVNYSPNVLLIALPVFAALFMLTSWLTGLYDSHYKQSRLNKSTALSILVILSFYSLLPENLRFSRGILLFGSLAAYGLMTAARAMLLQWGVIEGVAERQKVKDLLIIGAPAEAEDAIKIMRKSPLSEKVFGRVEVSDRPGPNALGGLPDMHSIMKLHAIRQIILCYGELSFKEMIALLPMIPSHIKLWFYAPSLKSIIGSDDRNVAGSFIISDQPAMHLEEKVYRRGKRIFDVITSLLFLLTFPIHIFTKRKSGRFLKNAFLVLIARNTWVGYSGEENILPALRSGIITTVGLPEKVNVLSPKALHTSDYLYAQHYEVSDDIRLVWKNYRHLS